MLKRTRRGKPSKTITYVFLNKLFLLEKKIPQMMLQRSQSHIEKKHDRKKLFPTFLLYIFGFQFFLLLDHGTFIPSFISSPFSNFPPFLPVRQWSREESNQLIPLFFPFPRSQITIKLCKQEDISHFHTWKIELFITARKCRNNHLPLWFIEQNLYSVLIEKRV